jgi:hypothetical protein
MSIYIGFRVFGFVGIFIGPSMVIIGKAIREAELIGSDEPVYEKKPLKINRGYARGRRKRKKDNNDKFNDSFFYRNEKKRIVVSELIFVFIYFNH